jgi:hypothetical protein
MGIFRDKSGEVFGRLKVLSFAGFDKNRHSQWNCKCSCGEKTTVCSANLASGSIKSCGCGEKENRYTNNLTHGHTRQYRYTPEYHSWQAMMARCKNPKQKSWKNYGGRGIKICKHWSSFEVFLKDMEPRPKGTTLERKNNDGNYDPGNCKWATPIEQARNRRPRKRLSRTHI